MGREDRQAAVDALRFVAPRPASVEASLPNCKLQTLERFICSRSRRDDLSGAQVPAAYHQFVRTGLDAAGRRDPAVTTRLDLVTLVQVTMRLLETAHASRSEARGARHTKKGHGTSVGWRAVAPI